MDTRTFYDRLSSAYDLLADASESACRNRGLTMLQARPGERILELGFGTGHALASLSVAVGPTGVIVGVDVSSGMLAMARRTVAAAGCTNVTLAIDDGRSLCFRDAVFDAAFMSFALELFEPLDIMTVLADVHRVLRPGGRLGVVAMAEKDSNASTDIYKWLHRHFPHFVDCRPINVAQALEDATYLAVREERMSVWGLSVACVVGITPDDRR
jgi:demethylmenaquinone methyltransferase/2-methoxy-6-polyprenyl-1,4-benzoquinol methylase